MLRKKFKGFTLIEILVVIGIIAILTAAAMVAINPFRQFAQANNANRWSGVTAILNAVSQRIVDRRGTFGACPALAGVTDCPATDDTIPTAANVCMGTGALAVPDAGVCDTFYDIYDCIVPGFIGAIPVDPQNGEFASSTNYNTGYQISCAAGRITISAPSAQLTETISVSH